jgi:hypothetical protein
MKGKIMKTNKLLISIGLPLIALSVSACSFSTSSTEVHKTENMVSRMITPDYGLHVQNHVSLLFGTALIPFKLSDFGIDKIVAGDQLEINYTGDYLEYETYPSRIDTSKMQVASMKLYEARIVEYLVTNVPGDAEKKDLIPTEELKGYTMVSAEYVINEDGTFVSLESFLKTAEVGTKLYGSNPASFNSLNVTALYSYNPRP